MANLPLIDLSGEQFLVRRIKEGTVIDHVEPGKALKVLRALGITGEEGLTLTVAMSVPSSKLGRKDIVKIERRFLNSDETNRIALIAPRATVNLVREYRVVEKRKIELPECFSGVLKCLNPTCVSNSPEPIDSIMNVVRKDPPMLQCKYCGRVFQPHELI